jgi:hypothetical protein
MPSVGFEPAIPATEWPHTHSLDDIAIGIGRLYFTMLNDYGTYVRSQLTIVRRELKSNNY